MHQAMTIASHFTVTGAAWGMNGFDLIQFHPEDKIRSPTNNMQDCVMEPATKPIEMQ